MRRGATVTGPKLVDPKPIVRREMRTTAKRASEVADRAVRQHVPRRSGALERAVKTSVRRSGDAVEVRTTLGGAETRAAAGGQTPPHIYNRFVEFGTGLAGPTHSPIVRLGGGEFGGIVRHAYDGQQPNPWSRKARRTAKPIVEQIFEQGSDRIAAALTRGR